MFFKKWFTLNKQFSDTFILPLYQVKIVHKAAQFMNKSSGSAAAESIITILTTILLTLAIWHSTLRDYMQVQVQVQCFLEINVFLVFVQFLGFTMLVKYINISTSHQE